LLRQQAGHSSLISGKTPAEAAGFDFRSKTALAIYEHDELIR
jgi:hypothetical protein